MGLLLQINYTRAVEKEAVCIICRFVAGITFEFRPHSYLHNPKHGVFGA